VEVWGIVKEVSATVVVDHGSVATAGKAARLVGSAMVVRCAMRARAGQQAAAVVDFMVVAGADEAAACCEFLVPGF
jgi:hypothetical protein